MSTPEPQRKLQLLEEPRLADGFDRFSLGVPPTPRALFDTDPARASAQVIAA